MNLPDAKSPLRQYVPKANKEIIEIKRVLLEFKKILEGSKLSPAMQANLLETLIHELEDFWEIKIDGEDSHEPA